MKKIAYIEIDTHAEIVGDFMELTQGSQKLSVDYYLSPRILGLLGLEQGENIFLATHESLLSQIKEKKYDGVIIGTAHRYFSVFQRIVEKFKTSIIVHNLNFAKASKWELFKNIFKKETKFRLKLLLKEGLLQKQKVYDKALIHWVLDENMLTNEQINIREKNRFLPLFFSRDFSKRVGEGLSVVIPGTVSQKRRDYKSVIQRLRTIKIQQKIKLIFLGKAEGEELLWIKKLSEEAIPHLEIVYFEEKVGQDTFDDYIKNADLLWCPIQENTEFFSIREVYGKTKMSGNIGDAIRYGKLGIFPENYLGRYPFAISEKHFFENQPLPDAEQIFENYKKEKILSELEKLF